MCLFLRVSLLLLTSNKCACQFFRQPANENEQLKETKTLISNSYLIRQNCVLPSSVWRLLLTFEKENKQLSLEGLEDLV